MVQSILHPDTITHHFTSTRATAADAAATCASGDALSSAIISRSHILIRLKEHEIDLRREEAGEHYRRADAQTQRKTRRLHFVVVARPEIYCDRGQEHDACRVHRESDVFRFVEVLWNFSSFECINRAEWNEEYYEDEGDHEAVAGAFAY